MILSLNVAPVYAKAGAFPLEKTYTFTSESKDSKYVKNQEITEGGKKYKAAKTEYKVLEEIKPEVIKDYTNLSKQEVPQEINDEGQTYKLKEVNYESSEISETKSFSSKENIPETISISRDGNTYEGQLIDAHNSLSTTQSESFSIPATFYGDANVDTYEINGKEIPATNAPEFSGYKNEILTYLGLDPSVYTLLSGRWDGGYQTAADGETYRNAIFTGTKTATIYNATYKANVYTAKAVYVSDAPNMYKISATVFYEPTGWSLLTKILIGVGLAIVAMTIAAIIIFLKRKKEDAENDSEDDYER